MLKKKYFVSLCCILLACPVKCFNLVTVAETLYKNIGESVALLCEVEGSDYDILVNTMQFVKRQGSSASKIVTNLGSTNEPFTNTTRYSSHAYTTTVPVKKVTLNLSISNLQSGDTGNYTCHVGRTSLYITHLLYVFDDIHELKIYGADGSSPLWSNIEPASTSLNYDTATTGMIQCVAHGGYPEPTISIYIGNEQKTGDFDFHHHCNLTGPIEGLQIFNCITMRGKQNYSPSSNVNTKEFTCTAHVNDFVPDKTTSVILNIKGKPKVIESDCPNVRYAHKKDASAVLECEFVSNPEPTSVSWRVDMSGIDVTSDYGKTKFQAVDMIIGDGKIKARLTISDIKEEDFHTYILKVINQLGEMDQRKIDLQESSERSALQAASSLSSSHLLTFILVVSSVIASFFYS